MRHPQADLIIAWANGAQIQVMCFDSTWKDEKYPTWSSNLVYRVKPKTLKYRFYLSSQPLQENRVFCWASVSGVTQNRVEHFDTFVKWLTPEMEIELDV